MNFRLASVAAGLFACGVMASIPPVRAAETVKPGISEEAKAAVQQMGKTLSAADLSFQVHTIRVYLTDTGQPLHIFHTMKVVAHRPDRLAVHVTGDDGSNEVIYDGKTVVIAMLDKNKYTRVAAPDNIGAMLDELMRLQRIDFPLADFLTPDPGKSFLSNVTSGRDVGTSIIDGKPYRHLFFSQAGGIELEVWLAKTQRALPLRLIVTYLLLPGQPNFIAEFSDWNFSAHPNTEFVFHPPAGAQQVKLKP